MGGDHARFTFGLKKWHIRPPPHLLYSDYVCLSYHFRASLLWIKSFLFLIKMPTDLLYLVETSSINKGGGECATF